MTVHFLKINLKNTIALNGKAVHFDDLGDNIGGRVLDDQTQAAEVTRMRDLVRSRRGGVSEVSEEEFGAKKKLASDRGLQRLQRASSSNPFLGKKPRVAAVSADNRFGPKKVKPAVAPPKTGVTTEVEPITTGTLADLHRKQLADARPVATPVAQLSGEAPATTPAPAAPEVIQVSPEAPAAPTPAPTAPSLRSRKASTPKPVETTPAATSDPFLEP